MLVLIGRNKDRHVVTEMVKVMKVVTFLQLGFFIILFKEIGSTQILPMEIDNVACRPQNLKVGSKEVLKFYPIFILIESP